MNLIGPIYFLKFRHVLDYNCPIESLRSKIITQVFFKAISNWKTEAITLALPHIVGPYKNNQAI